MLNNFNTYTTMYDDGQDDTDLRDNEAWENECAAYYAALDFEEMGHYMDQSSRQLTQEEIDELPF